MPDRNNFTLGIVASVFGFGAIILFILSGPPYFYLFGLAIFVFGIYILIKWSADNYIWQCDKCGTKFRINFKTNLLGINGGVNKKLLYCPSCKKKTWCNGHPLT